METESTVFRACQNLKVEQFNPFMLTSVLWVEAFRLKQIKLDFKNMETFCVIVVAHIK